jgi:hypothetical protein
MRLHILTPLVALVTALASTSSADVTKAPAVPRPTNGPAVILATQTDTNLSNAERLGSTIKRVKEDTEKITDLLGSLDDMVHLLESAEKEMNMLNGATNFVEITYPSVGGTITMMLINPFVSKGNSNIIGGRFHFLYPKEWKVSSSFCLREKNKTLPSTCGVVYSLGTNQNIWNLDLQKPFESLKAAEREKAKEGLEKFTIVPMDKLRFDPGASAPVWIADFGKEETAEKK